MEDRELKRRVINLATSLALQDRTTRPYYEVISECIEEACSRLHVNRKTFIKMFI